MRFLRVRNLGASLPFHLPWRPSQRLPSTGAGSDPQPIITPVRGASRSGFSPVRARGLARAGVHTNMSAYQSGLLTGGTRFLCTLPMSSFFPLLSLFISPLFSCSLCLISFEIFYLFVFCVCAGSSLLFTGVLQLHRRAGATL